MGDWNWEERNMDRVDRWWRETARRGRSRRQSGRVREGRSVWPRPRSISCPHSVTPTRSLCSSRSLIALCPSSILPLSPLPSSPLTLLASRSTNLVIANYTYYSLDLAGVPESEPSLGFTASASNWELCLDNHHLIPAHSIIRYGRRRVDNVRERVLCAFIR